LSTSLRNSRSSCHSPENQARTPEIILYDSGSGDISRLLDQAISDGCELAIGPLRKEKLNELISQHPKMMPIPTLALNRIEGDQFPSGLYQFGLNPQDEAQQIAGIARNKGLQRAMIITPEGNWGSKVAQAFAQRWQQAGGYISDSTNFNAKSNDYSKRIKQLLHIDQSEQRRRRLQQIIGMTPYFEPYRRSDADMIFLVARPNEGRAVKPLLAYHYAGDLPVYATSHIYRGNTDRSRDQDINGIHFVDIPWVFNSDSAIRQAINAHFARSDAFQRMYALGVDSFRLHMRINQLRTGSGQVFGETGTLTLNPLGQIERELTLAEIRGGVAVIDASNQE
jgi:outer membrane PBP1 activator LpoA protein